MGEEKEDPYEVDYISSSGVYKTPFTLIILVQMFVGGMALVLINLWFINSIYFEITGTEFYSSGMSSGWWVWILLPLNIYGNIFMFSFSIILFSAGINKVFLKAPEEGVFEKGSKEWKNMHRRFWLAYLPIWLARAIPLPWADIVVYRFFGVKIGKNVVAYEGYIDPVLVDIGDFTMTSLHICIYSHLIYHDKVIIKNVHVGKECTIGPQTLISPGTIMHDGAILGANSYTWVNQELEGNLIHVGTPVNFNFPIQSVEESKKKAEVLKTKVFREDDDPDLKKLKEGEKE